MILNLTEEEADVLNAILSEIDVTGVIDLTDEVVVDTLNRAGRKIARAANDRFNPWTVQPAEPAEPATVEIEDVPGITYHNGVSGRHGCNICSEVKS